MVLNIDAKIFELLDEKFDLVLFGVTSHVAKIFVLVARNDFVNNSRDAISNRNFCFVGGTKGKFPLVVLGPVERSSL